MPLVIVIVIGAFFALSVVVGLVLAAMLGRMSRAVTELHEEAFETEAWTTAPPTSRHGRRPAAVS